MGSIYKIQFPNGKYYIGLTTTSLEQRRQEHKYCAKRGETQCLYKALRKYDMIDTFELIEIDKADSLEELCEMEIIYIIEYNSHYINGKGYNMTFGGEGLIGYIYTEEDKQKQSKRRRIYFENNPTAGKEHSERLKKYFEDNLEAKRKLTDGKGKNKPFDIFTNDGAFVKTFTYQFEAKEYLRNEHHVSSTIKIDEVLAGRRKSSAGFVFKYK